MSQETVGHVLGVAVRIDDHFISEPIPDELDVRLDTYTLPTLDRTGTSRRHDDGTYRFIDLEDKAHQLQIRSPDQTWMLLDPLPTIVTPNGLMTPVIVNAWPTPLQPTPLGLTAVRGKLLGTPAATIGRRIEFDVNGVDTGHHTLTGSRAEFLFLFPGHLFLNADSLVPLTLRVIGNTVVDTEVIEGEQHHLQMGADFLVVPGRETRIRFHVT